MRRFSVNVLAFILGFFVVIGISDRAIANTSNGLGSVSKIHIQEAFGRLPPYFIRNDGQVNKKVRFYEHGRRHSTFFTKEGIYLQLSSQESEPGKRFNPAISDSTSEIIGLLPIGANKGSEIVAEDIQQGKVNYFIGNNKKNWRINVPTYRAVRYKEVYSGIDMRFYGNNSQLEYDIIVKSGADPSVVKLSYEGIKDLRVTEKGDLNIILNEGSLTQKKPHIYQEIDGKRVEVAGAFKILHTQSIARKSQSVYGFKVDPYNKNYPLIIDPVLVYSTYLGGSNDDSGSCIAVDTAGNIYIAGLTHSLDFPTQNPIQGISAGGADVFVTKISPSGAGFLYSTYLGGSDIDSYLGIAVDTAGNAYLTGYTYSTDFPTQNPIQASYGGGEYDAFAVKIDPSGSNLSYSTYLGGSNNDWSRDITVDPSGNAYITGVTESTDFPTQNPIQASNAGEADAFVTKISPSGASFIYSTYLGGSSYDQGYGIALDIAGNVYITGGTQSLGFPTQNPIQGSHAGSSDVFVTKMAASGASFSYSTYLGGSGYDHGYDIAVDIVGNAYITGSTYSTNFPTQNPIQGGFGGGLSDVFVAKIAPPGSTLLYSTYLGGSDDDGTPFIAIDTFGNAYVSGRTASADFPLHNSIQGSYGGGEYDAFVTMINHSGTSLFYSTYLGGSGYDNSYGIAVDTAGNAYITGSTWSLDFPTQNPIQASTGGFRDVFIAKIDSDLSSAPTALWKPALTQEGALALDSSGSRDEDGEIVSYDWQLVGKDAAYPLQGAIVSLDDIPWGCYDGTLLVMDNDGLSGSITFQVCKPQCEQGVPTCKGDFDKDGDVDGSDLAAFAADFGRTDCSADE